MHTNEYCLIATTFEITEKEALKPNNKIYRQTMDIIYKPG